jgi:hypothetical protein
MSKLCQGRFRSSSLYGIAFSGSQFNREYSRFFGQPPMRDIKLFVPLVLLPRDRWRKRRDSKPRPPA